MNKTPYPLQMGSIRRNNWRLRELIDQGLSDEELAVRADDLENQITAIANSRQQPPQSSPLFPESILINSGWEWAVYFLPSLDKVVKVPADLFPEVADPVYLKNSETTYTVCKKYLSEFVVDTEFKRVTYNSYSTNAIFQKRLIGIELKEVIVDQLSPNTKAAFIKLTNRILKLIDEVNWIPDLYLRSTRQEQALVWKINNIIVEDELPLLFDFTTYFDVWRLYPKRTETEIFESKKIWKQFLSDLSA